MSASCVLFRIERAIVEKDGLIIAVLVRQPANPDWPSVYIGGRRTPPFRQHGTLKRLGGKQ